MTEHGKLSTDARTGAGACADGCCPKPMISNVAGIYVEMHGRIYGPFEDTDAARDAGFYIDVDRR
jgi:hypothetical protein